MRKLVRREAVMPSIVLALQSTEPTPPTKPQPDGVLVKALARAWRWQKLLDLGVFSTVTEIAEADKVSKSYVSRILRLALLAPDIVETVLGGWAGGALTLERPLQAGWAEQRTAPSGAVERATTPPQPASMAPTGGDPRARRDRAHRMTAPSIDVAAGRAQPAQHGQE
jgi:hypothetical protein